MVCSSSGGEKVKDAWWNSVLPSARRHVEPAQSVEVAKKFVLSGLYKWSHGSIQSEIDLATQMVQSVADKQAASAAKASTAFLQAVYAQLPYYIRYEIPARPAKKDGEAKQEAVDDESEEGDDFEYGAKALHQMWLDISKRPADSLRLADLELFGIFPHLLAADERKVLDKLVSSIYSRAQPVAKSKSAPKSRKQAKPTPAAEQAASVVASLLGL